MTDTDIVRDTLRPVPTNWPAATVSPAIDAVLDRLERSAARLPMPLALPAIVAHAVVARAAYADAR